MLTHASLMRGLISFCGKSLLPSPLALLSEFTGVCASRGSSCCRGCSCSATPLGGPPSLRGTAPRGQMRIGDASSLAGCGGAVPLAAPVPALLAYQPLILSACISSATASAPPTTSASEKRLGAIVVLNARSSPMRTPYSMKDRSCLFGKSLSSARKAALCMAESSVGPCAPRSSQRPLMKCIARLWSHGSRALSLQLRGWGRGACSSRTVLAFHAETRSIC